MSKGVTQDSLCHAFPADVYFSYEMNAFATGLSPFAPARFPCTVVIPTRSPLEVGMSIA